MVHSKWRCRSLPMIGTLMLGAALLQKRCHQQHQARDAHTGTNQAPEAEGELRPEGHPGCDLHAGRPKTPEWATHCFGMKAALFPSGPSLRSSL